MSEENTNPQIYARIIDVMRAVGAVGKDKVNHGQKYNFRGIDDMYNALHAPMSEAGIFAAPRVLNMTREERKSNNGGGLTYTILEVEHRFFAIDGSSVSVVTMGEAMDSGDKSCNKAQSAAYKYALMELFCIPTEEKLDTEYETHEVAPRGSTPTPRQSAPPSPPRAPQAQNGQAHNNGNGRAPQSPQAAKPAPKLTPMQELMELCVGAQLCIDEQGRAVVPQIVNVLKKENFSVNISAENYQAAFGAIQRHYAAPAPTEPQRGNPQPAAVLAAQFDDDDSDPFDSPPEYPAN